MLRVGALVTLSRDRDLFLLKAVPSGSDRVRIQHWSDGTIRSAFHTEVRALSPEVAIDKLWNKISAVNRTYALRTNKRIKYRLSLIDEIHLFIANSYEDRNFGTHAHCFILEMIVLASWWQTYNEHKITHFHVYKKICAYCEMVGLDFPTLTLVKRRIRKLSSIENMQCI